MIAQLNDIAQIWWQWMGSMFWQVSLFIILITLLDIAIRRWAWPQVRYVLWGLVFLKLVIPPTWQMPTSIVSWLQPKVEEQISVRIETREWAVEEMQISASGISAQKQDKDPAATEKPTWQAIAFLNWIAGMIAFAFMLMIKMSRLPKRSQTRDKTKIPEWFRELLSKTSDRMNLKKAPSIIFSRDLKSPAVYGLFQPVLLLPEGYLDSLSEEQAKYVLIHELCHLKRGDLLVHWICLVIQVIYWFNPLLIWTRRQMRHVCEICCDLSVADILREKTIAYRDTLLATARELLTETVEPSLGFLGIFEEPFRLVSRLKWLEKKTWGNNKRKIAATIITSLIMIVCVMPMSGLSQTNLQNNDTEIQSDDHVKGNAQGIQDEDNALKPQFFIEVVVADVGKEAEIDLGFEVHEVKDLDLGAERYRRSSGSQKNERRSIPDLPFKGEPSNSISPAPLSFGILEDGITIGGESFTEKKAAIEAMKTEPGIYLIATPKVVAQDNTKATIETGSILELPFVNESPQEWNGKLSLEITPQIQEDGYILQEITLKVSQPIEGDPNRTVTKNIDTNVVVRDGQTVVIGGIRAPEDTIADENSSDRKELMMFLTTHIIKTKPDDYMIGVEYESDENLSSNIGSVTRYDTLIMEVDADKELDLDAELIGPPPPGSQIEEDDHYTVRGVYPGNQTDEGDPYDIERVEVLRGPQDTPDSIGFRAAFSTTVIDSYPKENGSGSPVKKSDSPTVSIYSEGEIAEPPDLPPNAYMSARGAVTTENPFSISLFKDDITIDGESFPDIEAVFESMKTEAGVNILGTPRTITFDDEEIKESWNMAYDKTSTVALGISSRAINGGGVQKMILLNISPPNDEKSKEGRLMTLAASLPLIEDGGAMVMIVNPVIGDAKAEQDNVAGKKLYVFLTPHVENF